jgi:hypothetical protein
MNKTKKTIRFLEEVNKWRRGDETIEMPHPRKIGLAIDYAVKIMKRYAKEKANRSQK